MKTKIKSIFLSDIHLGAAGSEPSAVLKILKQYHFENIFLIGDIIDGSRLKGRWRWCNDSNTFLQKILRLSRKGVNVVYITGNHDEFLREHTPFDLGDIKVRDEFFYQSSDKKIWLVHGDYFDAIAKISPVFYKIGNLAYDVAYSINLLIRKVRRFFHLPDWSLASYLKNKVKEAVMWVDSYEKIVTEHCKERGCDAIICGHIHVPVIKKFDGILYMNCGDWLDNRSYIIETLDGEFELHNRGARVI
jgi:UDP-2,3-diacylglucosamine pyrophosphatase LpxH